MTVKCFFLVPSGKTRVWLRRYRAESDGGACSSSGLGYHNAKVHVGDRPIIYSDELNSAGEKDCYMGSQAHDMDDPRWPVRCGCGYEFTEDDEKQVFQRELLRRVDTGELMTWEEAGPGAMRDCCWLHGTSYTGPDGLSLLVKCPNGHEWNIDSRASNCTLPDDNTHKCWCRHGTPPNITVGKDCNTCSAGAGSIMAGDYHGFLRNGEFT